MDLQKGSEIGTYNFEVTAGENRVVAEALSSWARGPGVDIDRDKKLIGLLALSSGNTGQVYGGLDDDTVGGLVNALAGYSEDNTLVIRRVQAVLEECGMPPIANSGSKLSRLQQDGHTANVLAFELVAKHETFMEPIPDQLPPDFA